MICQLDFDGREVAHPPRARRLTERQRALLQTMRAWGGIRTRSAYVFYADPSGALRRLEALGLVERDGRGRWRAR